MKTSGEFRRKAFEFAQYHDIPVHRFAKGERKDDGMLAVLKKFRAGQGVFFRATIDCILNSRAA